MAEGLLWRAEDLAPFLHHPQVEVRRWAGDRLIKLFPAQAALHLLAALDDPNDSVAAQAINFLGAMGDAGEYGPALAERLSGAAGWRFGRLAVGLARLGHRAALPALIERARAAVSEGKQPEASFLPDLAEALGIFGGADAREALWRLVEHVPEDGYWSGKVIQSLLQAAQPSDVTRLVARYRASPPAEGSGAYLDALSSAAGAGRLNTEIGAAIQHGFTGTLAVISGWLDGDPGWSDACRDRLERAFRHKLEDVPAIALDEARRLLAERGDDVAGWQAAWEGGADLIGYRRRAVLTLLVLHGMLDQRRLRFSQRRSEAGLSLALLSQLSVDRDDQLVLETAAVREDALLDILTANRESVLPGVVEQVAALGPDIVPRLLERFAPEDYGWGPIRIAQALTLLARRHPGSCSAAVSHLIDAINDEQGDFLLEDCAEALAAIGLDAVPAVAEHLTDGDVARPIYLAEVLGNIPTEGSVRALLAAMAEKPDVMQYNALADTGSALAITPLYELHDDESPDWVYSMLILCEVNGMTLPELPQWRAEAAAVEQRIRALAGDLGPAAAAEYEGIPQLDGPGPGAADVMPAVRRSGVKPKKGSVGKREQRRRATQRKKQRRKK
jgi:hypothetical protein